MTADPVRVNRIDVFSICPTLRLLQSIPLGLRLRTLLPAAVTLALLFAIDRALPSGFHSLAPDDLASTQTQWSRGNPAPVPQILRSAFQVLIRMLSSSDIPDLLRQSLRGACCLMVAGMSLVATSRSVSNAIGRSQRLGAVGGLRHAFRHWKSVGAATLLLGLFLILAAACFRVSLWFCERPGPDHESGSLIDWPGLCGAAVCLAGAFVSLAGWLLAMSAIGADSTDGADGLSRGISYVLSRFWLFCVCLTGILAAGAVSGLLMHHFLLTALRLVHQEIPVSAVPLQRTSESLAAGIVQIVQLSTLSAGTAISYLILRQAEDGAPLDELDNAISRPGQ